MQIFTSPSTAPNPNPCSRPQLWPPVPPVPTSHRSHRSPPTFLPNHPVSPVPSTRAIIWESISQACQPSKSASKAGRRAADLHSPHSSPNPKSQTHPQICSRPPAVAFPHLCSIPRGLNRSPWNILLSSFLWAPSESLPSPPAFLRVITQYLENTFYPESLKVTPVKIPKVFSNEQHTATTLS